MHRSDKAGAPQQPVLTLSLLAIILAVRLERASDLRMVARIVTEDLARAGARDQITLRLPDQPLMSDLDPDAFGIICRNLVENALRHGDPDQPIEVALSADGRFRVSNSGPIVPPEVLAHLTRRFGRAGEVKEGAGLGRAIVAAIAERIGSRLDLQSRAPGRDAGFEAALMLPQAAT